MEAFFVKVFTAVLLDPRVKEMLRQLLSDLMNQENAIIVDKIGAMEKNLLGSLAAIPAAILGDASKDVGILLREITGTTSDIAGAVKSQVSPLLDPAGFAREIIAQMVGGGQKPPWWPL